MVPPPPTPKVPEMDAAVPLFVTVPPEPRKTPAPNAPAATMLPWFATLPTLSWPS
jgi:hypothetical protein